MNPFRKGFLLAWLAASIVLLPVLTAPFLLPAETIYRLEPVCEWKARHNRECALCGMTRGFLAISRGEFQRASSLNRGSVPLYFGLILNELIAGSTGMKLVREGRRRGSAAARKS